MYVTDENYCRYTLYIPLRYTHNTDINDPFTDIHAIIHTIFRQKLAKYCWPKGGLLHNMTTPLGTLNYDEDDDGTIMLQSMNFVYYHHQSVVIAVLLIYVWNVVQGECKQQVQDTLQLLWNIIEIKSVEQWGEYIELKLTAVSYY